MLVNPPVVGLRLVAPERVEGLLGARHPADLPQLMRRRNRQRLPEHGFHQAEHRRVRADAERERQHGHGGERRRLPEQAEGVAQVGAQVVEQAKADGVAALLVARVETAELRAGPPKGLAGGHALAFEVGGALFDVELPLVEVRLVDAGAAGRLPEPRSEAGPGAHSSSGDALSTVAMMSAICSQFWVCSWNRRRPAAVSA